MMRIVLVKLRVLWIGLALLAPLVAWQVGNQEPDEPAVAGAISVVSHEIVYYRAGRSAAWPANNGAQAWSWGDEILIGFVEGPYVEQEGHNIGEPQTRMLARSTNGGETWAAWTPTRWAGDGVAKTPAPGGIDFAHPDFAMFVVSFVDRTGEFYVSYDRGGSWRGPYDFSGLWSTPQVAPYEFTGRTDYICDSSTRCDIFVSSGRPGEDKSDFAYVIRTTDGGNSFRYGSRIVPASDRHRSVMPSTVRLDDTTLITVLRRRERADGQLKDTTWIGCWVSYDDGQTWSHLSDVDEGDDWNGNPPALVRLDSGALLVVYGERTSRAMRARLSTDEGHSWGQEYTLRTDYNVDRYDDPDLGYARAFQRADGKVVAVYYWATARRPELHIAATILEVEVPLGRGRASSGRGSSAGIQH